MRWSSNNLGVRAVLGGTSLLLAVGCAERPQATKEQMAARGVEQQLVDAASRTERDAARERRDLDGRSSLDARAIGGAIPVSVDPGTNAGSTQTPGGAFFGGVRPDTTTSSLSTPAEGTPNVRVEPPKPVVAQPRPRPPGGWGSIRAACGRG